MANLPKFENPPIIETVLGVTFDHIQEWKIPHFGLFWDKVRNEFTRFEVRPPIAQPPERFPPQPNRLGLKLSAEAPEVRCLFVSEDDNTLIQVQPNRFLYNWRRAESDRPYPHYDDSIRPAFISQWTRFTTFLKSELGVSELPIKQCELSYINHIKVGEGWSVLSDLFPFWSGKFTTEFLSQQPELFELNFAYPMPDEQGRLRVSAQSAVKTDGTDIVQLNLTCRGEPQEQDLKGVMSWMDLARKWIVKGFVDCTSAQMHEFWKLRR